MFNTFSTALAVNQSLQILLFSFWLGVILVAFAFWLLSGLGRSYIFFRTRATANRASERAALWPELSNTAPRPLQRALEWSGWMSRRKFFRPVIIFSVFLVIVAAVSGAWWIILLLLMIGFVVFASIIRAAAKQQRLFLRQLPDGLQSLVDTLRAGYSLPQAIGFVAAEINQPLAAVFQALERGFSLNLEFSESLNRVALQLGIPEWTTVAETLVAQQSLGGNIVPLLAEQAKAVRDRINAEEEIRALTSAGRMSGALIAILMPLVVVFFLLVSPSYISILFQTILGRTLFALALALELIGFLWIRKVTTINF